MPKENQAELFIRVLVEEFEALRNIRKFGFSRQIKSQPKRFRHSRKIDQMGSRDGAEPLDCMQLMSTTAQPRIGHIFETQ